MPTKPNRAGKQQEYIPEGNGDASGEYSDGGGYNIHRPNPAKKEVPKENKPIPTITDAEREKIKSIQQQHPTKAQNTSRQLNEMISFVSGKYGEQMKPVIDNADEEMNDILLNTINNNDYDCSIGRKRACLQLNHIYLENKDFSESRVAGEVYYHEHGHYVDKNAGEQQWLSQSYRNTTTGESLKEVLKREGTPLKAKEIYDDFTKRKQELYDGIYKDIGSTKEEFEKKIEEKEQLLKEWKESSGYDKKMAELTEQKSKLHSQFYSGEMEYKQFEVELSKLQQDLVGLLNAGLKKNEEIDNSGVGKWLKEKRSKYVERRSQIDNQLSREYSILSDICGGMTKGKGEFWGGHGKAYWKRENSQAHEFFAEVFCARSIDKPLYEKIKTYLPESVRTFEEIIKGIRRK